MRRLFLLVLFLAGTASAGDFVTNPGATLPGPWTDSTACNASDTTRFCAAQANQLRSGMFDLREPLLSAPLVTTGSWSSLGNEKVIPICGASQAITFNGTSFTCIGVSVSASFPTCSAGQYLTYNGSAFACVDDSGGVGAAPAGAAYVTTATDATLTNEKVVSDCSSTGGFLTWNGTAFSCAGANVLSRLDAIESALCALGGGFSPCPAPQITGCSPASGPVGATVVCSGSALTPTASVTFNGVAATSFSSQSSAQVTAIVPATATTGNIVITTAVAPAASWGPFTVTTGTPGQVTGLAASNVSSVSMVLAWNVPSGSPTSYQVEQAPDAAGNPGTFANIGNPTAATFNVSGLTADTRYWFRVRAVNGAGSGPYSTALSQFTTGSLPSTLAAFPWCQGSGCATTGGRGSTGTIYRITSLANSGAGTLRECMEASGPRQCVFTTGGTIALTTRIWVNSPFLTVHGQSAQGGGIQIRGPSSTNDTPAIMITASDVVIRYLRVRSGFHSGSSPPTSGSANIAIYSGAQRVVIDHVSSQWSDYEPFLAYANNTALVSPRDISVSYSILGENVAASSNTQYTTTALSGVTSAAATVMTNIDMHHNLMLNNTHRFPLAATESGRIVNNIIYNWTGYAMRAKGRWDIIGNYYRRGLTRPIQGFTSADGNATTTAPSLYITANAATENSFNPATDNWSTLTCGTPSMGQSSWGNGTCPLSTTYQRATPLPAITHPITAMPTSDLVNTSGIVLTTVGASRRVDCTGAWVTNRDSVDTRNVNEFVNTTGIQPNPADGRTETTYGGWPSLSAGTACADSDSDGIPDGWEQHFCGATTACNPHSTNLAPPWTNLEAYLSGDMVQP